MRAIFVTGSLVHGGAERHSITLMNRLAERGHECHAVFVKNDPSQLDRIRLGDQGTVRCLHAQRFFDRRALADFAAQLTALQPSVLIAANGYALMYAALARWLAGLSVPLVVTFHSTKMQGAREQVKMLIDRVFFLAADCLVFVCDNQRRYWRRRGVFARRIEVIHNGIDAAQFSAAAFAAAAERLRRQHGFAASEFVIGMVAVLRPEKNHLQLLDAVAALRAQGIPARALMIGDGVMRAAIEARARQLNIARFVTITGFQEEVRPFIAACDVVLLCSVTEAFSLAAIEAMAMGKPVVHSDVGGAPEMITEGDNGFLFPVGDTVTLVHKLALLADRPRAGRMGDNARRIVEARFSEAAMLDRYERTLLDLCDLRPGDPDAVPRQAQDPAWRAVTNETQTRSQSS
jgi:glycosyltransferase involved in cell wall biosynthesis